MLAPTQDAEQVVERIAALDIGKAELVCCVRVPDVQAAGQRLQEVATDDDALPTGNGGPVAPAGRDPSRDGSHFGLRAM